MSYYEQRANVLEGMETDQTSTGTGTYVPVQSTVSRYRTGMVLVLVPAACLLWPGGLRSAERSFYFIARQDYS
jgi:hypothetical protein